MIILLYKAKQLLCYVKYKNNLLFEPCMASKNEEIMEMVLPLLVIDAMQKLESIGKHPEADFTERLRLALLKIIPENQEIEQDIWDSQKKEQLLDKICAVIEL